VTFVIGESSPKNFTLPKHIKNSHTLSANCQVSLKYQITIIDLIDGLSMVTNETVTGLNTFDVTFALPSRPTLVEYRVKVYMSNVNGMGLSTLGYFFVKPTCPDPPANATIYYVVA
jgi:hypothetical protein